MKHPQDWQVRKALVNMVDERDVYDTSTSDIHEPGKLQDPDMRYPSGEPDESEATVETEIMGNPIRVEGSITRVSFANGVKTARLVQRDGEWALVSKKDPSKVLKWFGKNKPSEKTVAAEERRVQYFKHHGAVSERHANGLGIGIDEVENIPVEDTPLTEHPEDSYQSYDQYEGNGTDHMGRKEKEALFVDEHDPIQVDDSAYDYEPDVPGHDSKQLSYQQDALTEPLFRSPFVPNASRPSPRPKRF
jgi:hypothetical protein